MISLSMLALLDAFAGEPGTTLDIVAAAVREKTCLRTTPGGRAGHFDERTGPRRLDYPVRRPGLPRHLRGRHRAACDADAIIGSHN